MWPELLRGGMMCDVLCLVKGVWEVLQFPHTHTHDRSYVGCQKMEGLSRRTLSLRVALKRTE